MTVYFKVRSNEYSDKHIAHNNIQHNDISSDPCVWCVY